MKPDLLTGVTGSAQVMKSKTSTVPIVFPASANPIGEGLVQSLARPGANVTGLSFLLEPLLAKQVELLAELLPKMSRIGYLGDPLFSFRENYETVVREAARTKRLTLVVVEAHDAKSLEQAFAELGKQKPGGLVIATTPVLFNLQREITERALRLKLPTILGDAGFCGKRRSYVVRRELYRRLPLRGEVRGSHPEGRQTGGSASGAVRKVRTRAQHDDGARARNHSPEFDPRACGSGDPMKCCERVPYGSRRMAAVGPFPAVRG